MGEIGKGQGQCGLRLRISRIYCLFSFSVGPYGVHFSDIITSNTWIRVNSKQSEDAIFSFNVPVNVPDIHVPVIHHRRAEL